MKGEWNKPSEFSITVDTNYEKLQGPPAADGSKQHWLPCDACGEVFLKPWDVVSFICSICEARETTEN